MGVFQPHGKFLSLLPSGFQQHWSFLNAFNSLEGFVLVILPEALSPRGSFSEEDLLMVGQPSIMALCPLTHESVGSLHAYSLPFPVSPTKLNVPCVAAPCLLINLCLSCRWNSVWHQRGAQGVL